MKAAFPLCCARQAAARAGALAHGAVGLSLLAGLTGFVAGCGGGGGGGAVAPVQSPTESAIPGRAREHVVGKGDTLYSIAWRHGVDYRTLAGVNSIRDPYTIFPGQRLLVPEPGEVVEPDPPREPARESVASESVASGDLSVRGVAVTQAPVATPLPSLSTPESKPSITPPRKVSTQPQKPAPEVVPKSVAGELPPKASAPLQRSVTKPAAQPPSAARTVAGLRWTRPTGGKTVSTFGRGGNKGIDIEGALEQPIRAAARGQVVYAGSGLIGYGKLVIVKHSGRLLSAYAHNERLHVGEGDDVKGGQHIADMGRSGKGRVMLHFEIRRDGKPIDPLRYLP